jgi:hypothetical protein
MKKYLLAKPISLTETQEHLIVQRKWWAVLILIVGGIMLAGRLPVPMALPYVFFFFGHGGMFHSFFKKRDYPMVIVNGTWMLIDIIGMIRWFS